MQDFKGKKRLQWEITTLACALADAIEQNAHPTFVVFFTKCIARRRALLKDD